jgi:hypothetical protein
MIPIRPQSPFPTISVHWSAVRTAVDSLVTTFPNSCSHIALISPVRPSSETMPYRKPWIDNRPPPHTPCHYCLCDSCRNWLWEHQQQRRASYDRARRTSQQLADKAKEIAAEAARKAVAAFAKAEAVRKVREDKQKKVEREREQERMDEEREREHRQKEEEKKRAENERDAAWVRKAREREQKRVEEVERRSREWEDGVESRNGGRGPGWKRRLVYEREYDGLGRRRTYVRDVRVRRSEVADWLAGW